MISYQESRLAMYMATRDYLNANLAIVNPLPSFSDLLNSFIPIISQMQEIRTHQEFDKKGITDNKRYLREKLVSIAFDTSKRLVAYATIRSNHALLEEANYKLGDLKQSSDATLKDQCQVIYERASANLVDLAPYGITEQSQAELINLITEFNSSIPALRLETIKKTSATSQIKLLFDAGDDLLHKIDVLLELVKKDHPHFFNEYRNARKQIIKGGRSSLALRAHAVDQETKEPIRGVIFSFQTNDGTLVKSTKEGFNIIKRTARKGRFFIKSIPEGSYKVSISKAGYKEQEMTTNIINGELTELMLMMEKN